MNAESGVTPASPSTDPSRENAARRGRRIAALVLLTVAIIALARDYWDLGWREWMLALIGTGFVVWSALARVSGLLVPGGILIGIGVGQMLATGWGGGWFLFSMAGGFLLIVALSRAIFGRQKGEFWPLYPAGGLLLAGLIQVAGSDVRVWLRELKPFWPYALILVALYLWFSRPSAAAAESVAPSDGDASGRESNNRPDRG